ncbi:hypothetical protein IFT77_16150 [Frigoribacterium sp. CFBP 13729]|uniref:hypothetical protein n=1 Tax=Frigoribacterium sp. CFBP 13729 TaxID=2775293 RepID=UPI00177DE77F|nr:hypothetical protein [Frigoribacterium sp. CFBP 13729]MBD8612024.1 hypothetical protein [Frigoribacterium sp. CFBP 13729]
MIIHAKGFDFGLRPAAGTRDHGSLPKEREPFAVKSGAMTQWEWDDAQARVARGDLARMERQTERGGLENATTARDAASRLGLTPRSIAVFPAEVFAFIVDGELRYPVWQFVNDRENPVLPHLVQLVEAFSDDMHPSTILGFMQTPQEDAQLNGVQLTPVEWLVRGGDVQRLVDILGSFLMS